LRRSGFLPYRGAAALARGIGRRFSVDDSSYAPLVVTHECTYGLCPLRQRKLHRRNVRHRPVV